MYKSERRYGAREQTMKFVNLYILMFLLFCCNPFSCVSWTWVWFATIGMILFVGDGLCVPLFLSQRWTYVLLGISLLPRLEMGVFS